MSASVIQLGKALRHVVATRLAPRGGGNVLGLDISSRVIGIAVLTPLGDILASQAIRASADEHPFRIAAAVSETVAELHDDFELAHVAVEDVLKSFRPGRFQTQGLFKLSALNGTIAYEAWRRTHASVEVYQPNSIRGLFGLTSKAVAAIADAASAPHSVDLLLPDGDIINARGRKGGEEATKLAVLQFVTRLYPDLADTWELTRAGTLDKSNYDRADALLAALFGLSRHLERQVLADEAAIESWSATAGFPLVPAGIAGGGHGSSGSSASSAAGGKPGRRRRPSAAASAAAAADAANAAASRSPAYEAMLKAFKALHAQSLAGELSAAGKDAAEESGSDSEGGSSGGRAAGSDAAPASSDGDGHADESSDSDSAEETGDEAAEAAAASARRKKPNPLADLPPANAAAVSEHYQEFREAFHSDFAAAFLRELVHSREQRTLSKHATARAALLASPAASSGLAGDADGGAGAPVAAAAAAAAAASSGSPAAAAPSAAAAAAAAAGSGGASGKPKRRMR